MKCCKHCGVGMVVTVSAAVSAVTAVAAVMVWALCKHSRSCDVPCECSVDEPCADSVSEQ